ncbi:hypothetical protein FAGAP_5482 [Fusarium agapanthi]|uniref:Uncharacterized protein n=1 Tax=Fusarium agapanthi TaxID=1803897 RepID=A0A9P5B9A0_9HYPO|nr:hypothetical protein FAGAP_5482 [Fusarium agapanthi]
MDIQQYHYHDPPQEESPDGSNLMSLFPQMPLRDLHFELENITEFFSLACTAPAEDRDNLKDLEDDFRESMKRGDLQALQELINPYLQPPNIRILHNIDFIQNELSDAPKEISDYYQHLIQRTKPGPHDLQVPPKAKAQTNKINTILEYTNSYDSRYDSARNFIKRLRLRCEMDRLGEVMELCLQPGDALENGLQYLQSIGTNDQPVDLISALPALIVAYSLIHQVPGQDKELEERFNKDLGRWKAISIQNQPDPFSLFEGAAGAAFAVKSFPRAADLYAPGNEVIPPNFANMYPPNLNRTAQLQSVAFDFFLQASSTIQEMHTKGLDADAPQNTMENPVGASRDHQAPDQHDSGIKMDTPVEDSTYSQMLDEDADYSWAVHMQPDAHLGPKSQDSIGFVEM